MELPANIVRADGTLNDELILRKEPLYKGMNGRFVERFYLSPTVSYIFKPLTNNGQLGQEVWVHENVLPQFPAIFPKIILHTISEQPELNWMILEDLGTLTHTFNEESVLGVIKWVAWWHSLSIDNLAHVPSTGLKPRLEDIVTDVLHMKHDFMQQLPGLQLDHRLIELVYTTLETFEFSNSLVLSHGDLHVGNFAVVDQRLMVLDWEHTHLNTPHWDLYHVIDMSHPLFPKRITPQFRKQILEAYMAQVEFEIDEEQFLKEYHLFSAVFSVWMLHLIQKDLNAKDTKWPRELLERQFKETILSLEQCAAALFICEKS
ncbi:phosphotransferase [Neobacillus rhizosphaerae]|uniref:phosphotransferase family protein n=1 Tax=Neobacillus rhizosphaerae TaxID=2880965 RepID=UPI003D2D243B